MTTKKNYDAITDFVARTYVEGEPIPRNYPLTTVLEKPVWKP